MKCGIKDACVVVQQIQWLVMKRTEVKKVRTTYLPNLRQVTAVSSYWICAAKDRIRPRGTYIANILNRFNVGYRQASCYAISSSAVFKMENHWNDIFKNGAEYFVAAIKEQWDEGEGRILLGDVTGGSPKPSYSSRSCYSVLGFGFSLDSILHTHTADCMYPTLNSDLRKSSICAGSSGTL